MLGEGGVIGGCGTKREFMARGWNGQAESWWLVCGTFREAQLRSTHTIIIRSPNSIGLTALLLPQQRFAVDFTMLDTRSTPQAVVLVRPGPVLVGDDSRGRVVDQVL